MEPSYRNSWVLDTGSGAVVHMKLLAEADYSQVPTKYSGIAICQHCKTEKQVTNATIYPLERLKLCCMCGGKHHHDKNRQHTLWTLNCSAA